MRVHAADVGPGGVPKPGAFKNRPDGAEGMSCNWDRYCTAEATRGVAGSRHASMPSFRFQLGPSARSPCSRSGTGWSGRTAHTPGSSDPRIRRCVSRCGVFIRSSSGWASDGKAPACSLRAPLAERPTLRPSRYVGPADCGPGSPAIGRASRCASGPTRAQRRARSPAARPAHRPGGPLRSCCGVHILERRRAADLLAPASKGPRST